MGARPVRSFRPLAGATRRLTAAGPLLAALACAPTPDVPRRPGNAPADRGTATRRDDVALPTFAEVAPLLHRSCAGCHRPGGGAPFALLTYDDAAPRATSLAGAVARGAMPPWLPVAGYGDFAGERRLAPGQVALLRRWAEAGAPRGPGPDPVPPDFPGGWALGEPDRVVRFPAWVLDGGGRDVYRNLVASVDVPEGRWVRAVEVDPGHPGVVHHARMMVDSARGSRALDDADPEPGFDGMDARGGAHDPSGFFVGWTPGKAPFGGRDDMAWRLPPGADLVLQLHLRPGEGRAEVAPRVALHFADHAPQREPVLVVLRSEAIDIPAGDSAWVVEDAYTLPVAVEALGVYPHAHYLGKRLHAWADLPGGGRRWLVRIDAWDFDRQDEYRYREPVPLPAGATLRFRYTYDNSAANPHNPSTPPRRVAFGPLSTDEMAELAVQLLPRSPADAATLRDDRARARWRAGVARDAAGHLERARSAEAGGHLDEALEAYRAALREEQDPRVLAAMAGLFLRRGEPEAARAAALQGEALARARGLAALADSLGALARRAGGGAGG